MAPQIKHISPEHYFNGKLVETTLFSDGNFIISYDGVSLADENVGKLPEGIIADDVYIVRMAYHVCPPGMWTYCDLRFIQPSCSSLRVLVNTNNQQNHRNKRVLDFNKCES